MSDLPKHVHIKEVGPREGFQFEKGDISLAAKISLVDALSDTGVATIEFTSFVSPKWVPQMADAEQMVAGIKRVPGVAYEAIWLNEAGLERAARLRESLALRPMFGVAATDTFTRKNTNRGAWTRKIAELPGWARRYVDEYYASSEAHGSTLIFAEDWLTHPGSVGKPMGGAVHILDEDGNELPPGHPGEVYFEGGNDFEYLNDPEKTQSSRDARGWKTVGDIGYLDEEGFLYLTDRRHHMIISGGVNIYPQEAENLLVTHPKVMDAAVFGVPDEEMGQRVKAVVQTVDPADATEDFGRELIDWLRDRLAHYKCPRSLSFEAQLPRTDTGKLYKQELITKYS